MYSLIKFKMGEFEEPLVMMVGVTALGRLVPWELTALTRKMKWVLGWRLLTVKVFSLMLEPTTTQSCERNTLEGEMEMGRWNGDRWRKNGNKHNGIKNKCTQEMKNKKM